MRRSTQDLAELLEPVDLGPREIVVREVGKRRAPPEGERHPQLGEGGAAIERPSLPEQLLELLGVGVAGRDPQQVPAGDGLEVVGFADLLSKLRDQPLDAFVAVVVGRRPQSSSISLSVETDSFAWTSRTPRSFRSAPAADGERARPVIDLEWTENRESHRCLTRDRIA